ncbi:MAG: NADH-quinone oxidoreductase subunit J [Hyphomicrobium sp.]
MNVIALFFYIFSVGAIFSALMVIFSRNPVHSVLFLILTFFNAAGLFILLGAEFLAMLLVIVYVGAVAVLFLFVVMMLDVDFDELRAGFIKSAPLGLIIASFIIIELIYVFYIGLSESPFKTKISSEPLKVSNIFSIGNVLYTKYFIYFQLSALLLLVSMIGAITLTLRHRAGVKRQNISDQNARTPETSFSLVKIAPGQAIIPEITKKG